MISPIYIYTLDFLRKNLLRTQTVGVFPPLRLPMVKSSSNVQNLQAPAADLGPSRWKLRRRSWYLPWIPGSPWTTLMEKIWKLCSLKSREKKGNRLGMFRVLYI